MINNLAMKLRIPLEEEKLEENENGFVEKVAFEKMENRLMPKTLGDPNFPNCSTSISVTMISDQSIKWDPAEKYC